MSTTPDVGLRRNLWILAALAVLLLLAVGCGTGLVIGLAMRGGAGAPAGSPASARQSSAPGGLYDREAFKREFLGADLDDVRRKLGAPDDIERPLGAPGTRVIGEGFWRYARRTKDPATGRPDANVYLWPRGGRVDRITW